MAVNVGTAVAYLTLDTKQYMSGMQLAQQQMQNFVDKTQPLDRRIASLGGALTAVGKTASVAFSVPILGASAAAFKLASDVEEAINKVEVAFGESADDVKAWSDTTLESFGIAKGSALDMAALFGDMATSMQIPQAEAAKMSKSLVGLAGDMASYKNISQDVASNALKAIFTGETESLKNLGVVMTQTNLEAYALSKGIQTNIKDMTEAEKVQLRYSFVLDRTKNSQGDFARTLESPANQMRVFSEGVKELGANFGQYVVPVFTPIIAGVNDLVKSFGELEDGTKQFIVTAGLMVAAVGPLLLVIGKVTTSVSGLIGFFSPLLTTTTATTAANAGLATSTGTVAAAQTGLVVSIKAVTTASLASAKAWLLTPMGMGVAAVAGVMAIVTAVDYLSKGYERQKEKVKDLTDSYSSLKSELETMEDKFKTTNERLQQLQQLKSERKLSVAEDTELTQLENANKALAIQLDIKRQLAKIEDAKLKAESDKSAQMARDGIKSSVEEYKKLSAAIDEINSGQREFNGQFANAEMYLSSYKSQLSQTKENLLKYAQDLAYNNTLIDANTEAGKAQIEANNAEIKSVYELFGIQEEYADSLNQTAEANNNLAASAEEIAKAQAEASKLLKENANSYKDAIKNAITLADAQKQLEKTGKLDSSSLENIIDLYPEAIAFAGDFASMQDFVSQKIAEQEKTAFKSYQGIIGANSSAITAIMSKTSSLSNVLAGYYGTDLKNFNEAAKQKFLTEAETVKKLSDLWAKYAGRSQQQIETQITKLEQISMRSKTSEAAKQKINELLLVQEAFGALEKDYKKLNAELAISPEDKGIKSIKNAASETNEELQKQLNLIDHLKRMGQLSTEEEIQGLEKIKASHKLSEKEQQEIEERLYSLRKSLRDESYKSELDTMDHLKKMGQLTTDEEIQRLEQLKSAYVMSESEQRDIEERLYSLRKNLRDDTYREQLEDINELSSSAEQAADFSAIAEELKRVFDKSEAAYKQNLLTEEEYVERSKELNKQIAEAVKNRVNAASKDLTESTQETISNIDRVIAQQKELSGLEQEDGTVFKFTSADEIALIKQKIVANDELINSIKALTDEQGNLTKEQINQLKQLEGQNRQFYDSISSMQVKAKNEFQSAQNELQKLNTDYAKNLSEANRKYAESVAAINKKLSDDLASAQADYESKVTSVNKKLIDGERQITDQYENELDQRKKSIANFTGLFSEVVRKDVSGQQLLDNLRGQLDAMQDWSKNMAGLANKGIDKGLLKELEGLGPSAADEIKALNGLTEEELNEYVKIYQEKNALAKKEAVNQMADQRKQMQKQLQTLRQEISAELDTLNTEYQQKISELNENASAEIARQTQEWNASQEQMTRKHAEEAEKINAKIVESSAVRTEVFKQEQVIQGEQEVIKTENTKTELKRQEDEVYKSQVANENTLKSFVPNWLAVGREYGNMLLEGIQGTRSEIQSYLASVAQAVRSAQEGRSGSINAYAVGTDSAASGLALVGESGPEIVDFSGGEQVLNFRRRMALIGNAVSTVSSMLTVSRNANNVSLGASSGAQIDYEKLAQAIAKNMKPSVNYSPTYNSPKEASIAELRKQDQISLQRFAMGFSLGG